MPYNFFEDDDEQARLLEKAIIALTQEQEVSKPQVVLYGLDKPYYLNAELAKRLPHPNQQGDIIRTNIYGSKPVARVGDVFFKYMEGQTGTLIEQAVYQFSRALDSSIVAPTRLLFLKFPHIPDLIPLQASLAVDGISLNELLQVPAGIAGLKHLLGEKGLLDELPALLSDSYLQEWLEQHPAYKEGVSRDEEVEIFWRELFRLSKEQRPCELADCDSEEKIIQFKRLAQEQRMLEKFALFPVLALLARYPQLRSHDEHLRNLLHLPQLFMMIKYLCPRWQENVGATITTLEGILDKLEAEQVGEHILLTLLTEPQDHKGDNFKVRVNYDKDNVLQWLEIVAIDNDMALGGTTELLSNGKHEVQVKSVFYTHTPWLNQIIASSVRMKLLSLNPELIVLQWLAKLQCYQAHYHTLLYATAKELGKRPDGLIQTLDLYPRLPNGFVGRVLGRLKQLKAVLTKNEIMTHGELLKHLEPLLFTYYQELGEKYEYPEAIINAVYKKDRALEDIILTPYPQSLIAKPASGYEEYHNLITSIIKENHLLDSGFCENQIGALLVLARLKQTGYKYLVDKLTISTLVFARVYSQEKNGFICFLKEDCKQIILQLSATLVVPIDLAEPQALFQLIPIPEIGAILLEGLLAYGLDKDCVRSQDGYTLLHYAARFDFLSALNVLIKARVYIDAVNIEGESALDKAIQYGHYQAAEALIKHGAGKVLQLANGLGFIEQQAGSMPDACQQLLTINKGVAWQFTLKGLVQEAKTPEKVLIGGLLQGRYLRSEIYQQIFIKGGVDEFPRENVYGRHAVTSIRCSVAQGVEVGLHLKENPEFVGREMMVQHLAHSLFGPITPHVALWRFNKIINTFFGIGKSREVVYPVLASSTIEGETLLEMLNHPERLEAIDLQSFSEAVVLAMLINPEDGRADNYIVEPVVTSSGTQYRIISIDNDHAFVLPLSLNSDGSNPKDLRVKTILYCMEQMNTCINPDVRSRILEIDAALLLKAWLEALAREERGIHQLFNDPQRKELQKNNIHLDIAFKPSIIAAIYEKLLRLQEVLKQEEDITLIRLLCQVIPQLGARYRHGFNTYVTVQERFDALTKGCFASKIIEGEIVHESKTPPVMVIEMTCDALSKELALQDEQVKTPKDILAYLDKIHSEHERLIEVRDELLKGNTAPFIGLALDSNKEKVINGQDAFAGFDFGLMVNARGAPDIARQKKVLTALYNIQFKALRLMRCAGLTEREFINLAKIGRNLLALELRGCEELTQRAINSIARFCPNLEKLVLIGLPTINSLTMNAFEMPNLRVLMLADCPYLSALSILSPKLERVEIKNCPKLTYSSFYEKYPLLIMLPFEEIGPEFAKALSEILEKRGALSGQFTAGQAKQLYDRILLIFESLKQNAAVVLKSIKEFDEKSLSLLARGLPYIFGCINLEFKVIQAAFTALERMIAIGGDSDVRKAALEVHGKLTIAAGREEAVMTVLLQRARDDEETLRAAALEALGKLTITAGREDAVLTVMLQGASARKLTVRIVALETLGKLTITAGREDEVLTVLLQRTGDANEWVRRAALEALGKLTITAGREDEVLIAVLGGASDKDSWVRAAALKALGKLTITAGREDEVLTVLLNGARADNIMVSAAALETLGKLTITAGQEEAVLTVVLRGASDGDKTVRRIALEALGKLTITAGREDEVLTVVLRRAEDRYETVRAAALEVLDKLTIVAGNEEVILKILLRGVERNGSWWVRQAALKALNKLTITADREDEVLTALLRGVSGKGNGSWWVRKTALALDLTTATPNEEAVLVVVLGGAKDDDMSVRKAALEALGKLTIAADREDEVLTVLLGGASDKDSWVRRAALEALGNLTIAAGKEDVVLTALLQGARDDNEMVRKTAFQALGTIKTPVIRRLHQELAENKIDKATFLGMAAVLAEIPMVDIISALLDDIIKPISIEEARITCERAMEGERVGNRQASTGEAGDASCRRVIVEDSATDRQGGAAAGGVAAKDTVVSSKSVLGMDGQNVSRPEATPGSGFCSAPGLTSVAEITATSTAVKRPVLQQYPPACRPVQSALQQIAESKGFDCENVCGDGNCFFHAVQAQLKIIGITDYDYKNLREIAVDYIVHHPEEFAAFLRTGNPDERDINAFIDKNVEDGTWVEEQMIIALMNGLAAKGVRLNLVIIRSDGEQPTEVNTEAADRTIYLGYQVGVHYWSLVPRVKVSSPAVSP